MIPKITIILIIIGIIVCITGITLLAIGLQRNKKASTFKRIEGINIVRKGFSLDHGKPIAEYEVEGETYKHISTIGQQVLKRHGEKLYIRYNPDNPKEAIIDNFVRRGGRNIVFGSLLIGASIILFLITVIQISFNL